MDINNKALKISLFNWQTVPMRTFHMSWLALFMCFFGWFGVVPFMGVIREEFQLTQSQIGNIIIASVAATVVARVLIGWLCDRFGPRLTYTWLMIFGSIPVMTIGLAQDYQSFLLFRLAIGAIGASFVISQYHTSIMFAPNCVGTANATTAGWGNLGAGVALMAMPFVLVLATSWGANAYWGWRVAMIFPGIGILLTGMAYYFLTQDSPDGNFKNLRKQARRADADRSKTAFLDVCKDSRVWVLFVIYGASFGVELTINNIAALYFMDYFGLSITAAGLVAGSFGLLNLFARTIGGALGDSFGMRWGLRGRMHWLFVALVIEGLTLMLFSRITGLTMAIAVLIAFSLFVKMSEGATFSVVPFINKKNMGCVAGIVGAGGNLGAVAAGFLFRGNISWPQALWIQGLLVTACAFLMFVVKSWDEKEIQTEVGLPERLLEGLAAPKEEQVVSI